MAQTYDEYFNRYDFGGYLFRTQTLGDLILSERRVSDAYVATEFTFHHKALDLHVRIMVSDEVMYGTCQPKNQIVEEAARNAERQMLQILRDKLNPPPKPAPAPSYAIQQSGGSAVAYLSRTRSAFGGSWSWEKDIINATLFNKPHAAVGFLSECVAKHGQAFNSSITVVRVDILTQTMEKRVATVLK
jgi:hypothetical protein